MPCCRRASRVGGRLAAGALAPDYATLAVVRGDDVIFFRNRAAERSRAIWPTSSTRPRCITRIGWAAAASRGRARRRVGRRRRRAERLRRQIEERLGVVSSRSISAAAAALRDRIAAEPELLDALAPAVGVLLRDVARLASRAGSRWPSAADQPFDPAVLQRARRSRAARLLAGLIVAAADGLERCSASSRCRGRTPSSSTQINRDQAEAERLTRRGARRSAAGSIRRN